MRFQVLTPQWRAGEMDIDVENRVRVTLTLEENVKLPPN